MDYIREGSKVEVSDEIIAEVDQVKQDIIDGKIEVPANLDDAAAFIAKLA